MAGLIGQFDWSATPLGPRESWPQSLRTVVDLMLASGHAMCITWGPGLTLLYNDGYAPFLGERHPKALGMSFADVWSEIWDDIGPLVASTYAGETSTMSAMPLTMTRNGYEEETWWDFSYSPLRDDAGKVAGLLDVATDATPRMLAERDRDQAQASLRESAEFMRNVLAASTDCIEVVELDGTLSFMSEGGMRVMEVGQFDDVKGCAWPLFLKDGGNVLAHRAIEAAQRGETSHFEAYADTFTGTPKYWSVSVSPIRGADGTVERILSVSRDHTELEQAREQQRLLNHELDHRLKNMLTMVHSLANQTLRDAPSLEAASAAFSSRLASLGRATNILTASSWHAADLRTVIEAGLAGIVGHRERMDLKGPAVHLNAQAALALTLALHELATNATKYGALSNDTGTVALEWEIGEASFTFLWKEQGGPLVTPPAKRGFGSRLIERSLRSYFRGEAVLQFAPEGVEFRIDAPLDGAIEQEKV